MQCMCSVLKCISRNISDRCNNCPIKCINPATGEKYNWEPNCTCPICNCTCTACYAVDEFHKLSLDIVMYKEAEKRKKEGSSEESPYKNINTFLASSFAAATQSGLASLKSSETKDVGEGFGKKKMGETRKTQDLREDQWERMQDSLNESFALNIARDGPQLTTHQERQKMASLFGTDTIVSLPSGNELNTRNIGQVGKNKHAANNKLLGNSAQAKSNLTPLPGMADNLNPDWSNPSDEWKRAAGIIENDLEVKKITPEKRNDCSVEGRTKEGSINLCDTDGEDVLNAVAGGKVAELMKAKRGGAKEAWQRMKKRNKRGLFSDKEEGELSPEEAKQRKKSKKIGVSMIRHESNAEGIVDLISDGIDIPSGQFCSQTLANRFYDLFMPDEEK